MLIEEHLLAAAAGTCSLLAILGCAVAVPSLLAEFRTVQNTIFKLRKISHAYGESFQIKVADEVKAFRLETDSAWTEVLRILIALNSAPTSPSSSDDVSPIFRPRRHANTGLPSWCHCEPVKPLCPPGPAGPPGVPGYPGSVGIPGEPGKDGEPWSDRIPHPPAAQPPLPIYEASGQDVDPPLLTSCSPPLNQCIKCPAGPPGKPGPGGEAGPRGPPGRPGVPGSIGRPGQRGPLGPPGEKGADGWPGARGRPGVPGRPGQRLKTTQGAPGRRGAVGAPGNAGPPGSPGKRGVSGWPGKEGFPGAIGRPGVVGIPGMPGRDGAPGEDAQYCRCPPRTLPPLEIYP